jgi:hypothetical protein
MLPIVATLLSQGLSILGNAVMAKGQEVIEEKLGIDIAASAQTPEGLLKLKQAEIDYEEFLRNAALEEDKMFLADVANAREMNARIAESANAQWLSKNVVALLAVVVVIGGGFLLWFSREADVRIAVVSLITMVLGFYFGSSKSSRGKDDAIADLIRSKK